MVVLTTHYLEEAEALADRIAIMDQGRIAVCGTPGRDLPPRAIHRLHGGFEIMSRFLTLAATELRLLMRNRTAAVTAVLMPSGLSCCSA